MKSVYKSMGVKDSNITNPAQIDRVKPFVKKEKLKATFEKDFIKPLKASEKEVNESSPKYKQNSPDYTPAKRPKPTVIVKQKKRTFPSK